MISESAHAHQRYRHRRIHPNSPRLQVASHSSASTEVALGANIAVAIVGAACAVSADRTPEVIRTAGDRLNYDETPLGTNRL
jgi:hypothetical protein